MDKIAEDRQWPGRGVLVGKRNRVANAKAHPQVLRADDAEWLTACAVGNRQRLALHCKVIIDDESGIVKRARAAVAGCHDDSRKRWLAPFRERCQPPFTKIVALFGPARESLATIRVTAAPPPAASRPPTPSSISAAPTRVQDPHRSRRGRTDSRCRHHSAPPDDPALSRWATSPR